MAAPDVFAREGEYWTVAFDGRVSRLRDSKGMAYLAELLRHPGEDLPTLDLAGAHSVQGDAGEVLDEEALRAYRRRAAALREDLEEAEAFGDAERAARVRLELDALAEQLSAGLGLQGRHRRSGAPSERARVAVTKAIRTALTRIREADPELGRHLDATVRTGTFCSYRPDTRVARHWQAAPTVPAAAQVAAPVLARRRTSFVGRADELRALLERVGAATRGEGAMALVGGDPGVGKSRLLDELAAASRASGPAVLAGRCVETGADAPVAYLPFTEVFEQLVRDREPRALAQLLGDEAVEISRLVPHVRRRLPAVRLPADVAAGQAQRVLFMAVGEVLARLAAAQPLLLMLEDLHWADGPSLALLEHLAPRLPTMPILLVGTYRPSDASVGTPLARTLERLLARHEPVRLTLAPLDHEEVARLVRGLHGGEPPAGLVERLARESGGNPFFVEELYQHLAERDALAGGDDPGQLPESVRLVLGHRLERLSLACRDALTLGAIAGGDFDETLLAAAGADRKLLVDALDEALDAGLLAVARGRGPGLERYRFSHALIRQAMLAGLSPARRRRLHLALAAAVEQLHPDDPSHAAEHADHLERAGPEADPLRASKAQQRAAARLLELGAFHEALDRLERAIGRCPPTDDLAVAELLADRGNVKRALGRMDDAFADWYAALDRGGRGWLRAPRVCRDLARTLDITGRLDEALEAARRGLELAGPGPTAQRSRLLASLAYALDLTGAPAEADGVLEEALAIADRLGDIRVDGDVQAVAVTHHFINGDHAAEARAARKAAQALVAAGELWDGAQATMMRMLNALRRGNLDEAEALDAEVAPLARRAGHAVAELWRRRCVEAVRLARTGDVEAYAAFIAEDLDFCRANRLRWVADALVHAGMCAFWQGDVDRARAHLDEAAAVPSPPAYIGRYSSARFVVDAWAGDEEAFARHHGEVRRSLAQAGLRSGRTLGRTLFLLSSLEAHVLLGHYEEAGRLHGAVAQATRAGMVLRLGDLRLVPILEAVAAGCAGRWDDSDRILAVARRTVETGPYRREQPDLHLFEGILRSLPRRGNGGPPPQAAFAEAAERYGRLGMPLHAELARRRS